MILKLFNFVRDIWILPVFFLVSQLLYRGLTDTYFQSDEWYYFLNFLPHLNYSDWILRLLKTTIIDLNVLSGGGHMTPLYSLFWGLLVKVLGLHYEPYAIISLITHTLNSYIVYLFLLFLFQKRITAISGALFFLTSSSHSQAVTWIMAFVPTQTAFMFSVLSILYLIKYFKSLMNRKMYLLFFVIFLIIGLMFKETSVFVYFLALFIWISKYFINKRPYFFLIILIILAILYVLYRFSIPLFLGYIDISNFSIISWQLVYRIVTYPLRVLVNSVVPVDIILALSDSLVNLAYPAYESERSIRGSSYLQFVEGPGSDIVIFSIGYLLITLLIYFGYLNPKTSNPVGRFCVGFCLTALAGTAWPLLLISYYASWWGYSTFIDSRHLYPFVFGLSVVFSWIVLLIATYIKTLKLISRVIYITAIAILFYFWLFTQIRIIHNDLTASKLIADDRKKIIQTILTKVPPSTLKKIIFVESDTGYYGFHDIVPFQTSLGQILLVQYYVAGNINDSFLKTDYLTGDDLFGQGYKYIKSEVYGFYGRRDRLYKDSLNENFLPEWIYAFSWKGSTKELIDITNQTREKIAYHKKLFEISKNWNDKVKTGFIKYNLPHGGYTQAGDGYLTWLKKNGKDMSYNKYCSNSSFQVNLFYKDSSIAFHEYIKIVKNRHGELIGDNFKVELMIPFAGKAYTIVIIPNADEYYIPSHYAKTYLRILAHGCESRFRSHNDKILNIISDIDVLLKTIEINE